MTLRLGLLIAFVGFVVSLMPVHTHGADFKTENLVLITMDGVRVEEMFAGLDARLVETDSDLFKEYWAETPEQRRAMLMPFFWGTWMKEHGSIAGNPAQASLVKLGNRRRFSYPGYAELLTGAPRDAEITSNAKIQNPFPTVLEYLRDELHLNKNGVCAFASWDVFEFIVEQEPGTVFLNTGYMDYQSSRRWINGLSDLQHETKSPWDSVRHDAYTFRFAMDHIRTHKPRVIYLALGETDDWAHDRRYDRVIQALKMSDDYFRQLWTYLQSEDQYRGKTTIMITTDHGRGRTQEDWPHHGSDIPGAEDIWLAVISPDLSLRGEWSDTETIYMHQIASTLCAFLELDFRTHNPEAGKPIEKILRELNRDP